MSRSPTLAEAVRMAIDYRLSKVHTCLPGCVEVYDPATQTAQVKPTVKLTLAVDGGEEVLEIPVLPSVPVAHPRAGDWFIHLPIAAGDFVMLCFAERSIDQWRALGGVRDPQDVRKHDLSDAIALPVNLYPDARALAGLNATDLVIGKQGGAQVTIKPSGQVDIGGSLHKDAVAMGPKLAALINALDAWVPVPNDGGLALKTLLATAFGAPSTWSAGSSSSKVSVDP